MGSMGVKVMKEIGKVPAAEACKKQRNHVLPSRELTYPSISQFGKRKIIFKSDWGWDL